MKKIAFQGEPGAYSHLACHEYFPDMEALPCASFADAIGAVVSGDAFYAMIPVDNSVAGRVADVHHLLPESGLHIVAEKFLRVQHQLLGVPGAKLENIKRVHSHIHALGQCRQIIRQLGIKAVVGTDTAGSARLLSENPSIEDAAIASTLAEEIYGLDILKSDVEDEGHNTTRFFVMSKERDDESID